MAAEAQDAAVAAEGADAAAAAPKAEAKAEKKRVVRLPKPDKAAFEAKLEALQTVADAKQARIKELKAAIAAKRDARAGRGDGAYTAGRTKLNDTRAKLKTLIDEKKVRCARSRPSKRETPRPSCAGARIGAQRLAAPDWPIERTCRSVEARPWGASRPGGALPRAAPVRAPSTTPKHHQQLLRACALWGPG